MFQPIRGSRLVRRFTQLIVGLVVFGAGVALIIQSRLGNPPWDVLHQGLARQFDAGWSTVGNWTIIMSFVVLLAWIPLRQRLGIGTLLNAIIIGLVMDVVIARVSTGAAVWERFAQLGIGTVLIGIGSGAYIGARLGPGPRDGLMTGISSLGPQIWTTRLSIEASALLIGWMLGGTFGVGTVIFVLAIGPLVQLFITHLTVPE